jgi:PAS domain S-box-containing protein
MSPKSCFLRILAIIAIAEFLLQIVLAQMQLPGGVAGAALHMALLAGITAPFLYIWVVRVAARQLQEAAGARASKVQFRALLDSVVEGTVFVDVDGRIMHVNRQAEDMFGFERTELINQPVEVLVPKRFRDVHVKHREGYTADPRPVPMGIGREVVGRRRDGEEFLIELSLSPIELETGPGVLALVTDISDRRRVEEERRLLSTAVEQSAQPVWITDDEGSFEYVNPAFERITGYTREEVLGLNPRILKSDIYEGSFYEKMWNTLKAGRVWESKLVNRRKSGGLYKQVATITPVRGPSGTIAHFVAVAREVTQLDGDHGSHSLNDEPAASTPREAR